MTHRRLAVHQDGVDARRDVEPRVFGDHHPQGDDAEFFEGVPLDRLATVEDTKYCCQSF